MSDLLSSLYKEYELLNGRLEKVREMIVLYGGTVNGYVPGKSSKHADKYPTGGLWKDRIKFVIKGEGRDMTVREIADTIYKWEPELGRDRIDKAVTQYVWSMSSKNELYAIEVDGGKNKYSLPVE
jgi:hypothetical protein